MASLFDTLFSTNGFPALQSTFGEPVVYRFRAGTTEDVDVLVNREPNQQLDEKGEVYQPRFLVIVPIASRLVDTGGDKIDLLEHPTDTTAKTYSVLQIMSQNGSTTELAIG